MVAARVEVATRCAICKTTHTPSERPHTIGIQAIERERELAALRRKGIYVSKMFGGKGTKPALPLTTEERHLHGWATVQAGRGAPADDDAIAYAAMLLRDPCSYCGSHTRVMVDHIVSISKGGETRWWNLAACCVRCNSVKNASKPITALHRVIVRTLKAAQS